MLIQLAALFAAQGQAATPVIEVRAPIERARPRALLGSYFSPDDYPAAALRDRDEGTTGVRLTVDPTGRVNACSVIASSGSPALDSTACRILRSRARYTPARDRDGNPVADVHAGEVTWALSAAGLASARAPAAYAPGAVSTPARARANLASYVANGDYPRTALENREQGIVHFRLQVGADGRVTNCVVTRSSSSQALDSRTCMIMRSRARFTPARDAAGNPVPDQLESSIGWHLS